MTFLLDRASLNAHASTFSETLYALRRAPIDAAAVGGASRRPLTSREKRRTLAFLVLAPYLRSKMEALYMRSTRPAAEAATDWRNDARVGEQSSEGWSSRVPLPLPPQPTTAETETNSASSSSLLSPRNRARLLRARQLAVHAFARAYPALAAGMEGARFIYQASYLLDAPVTPSSSSSSSATPSTPSPASFFSPSLHLLGQAVVRVSGPELAEAEAAKGAARARAVASARRRGLFGRNAAAALSSSMTSTSTSASVGGSLRVAALKTSWAVSDHSRSALILAVFGFKLLEWWYLSGEHRLGGGDRKALPPPPPPPAPLPAGAAAGGVPLPRDRALCPLCLRRRTNPALATCSGYVFCYPCLHAYVLDEGCCPVTRIACGVDGIRRLFQES